MDEPRGGYRSWTLGDSRNEWMGKKHKQVAKNWSKLVHSDPKLVQTSPIHQQVRIQEVTTLVHELREWTKHPAGPLLVGIRMGITRHPGWCESWISQPSTDGRFPAPPKSHETMIPL